jgi:photosystem II stability/assembly factor-like uncharacterized protein
MKFEYLLCMVLLFSLLVMAAGPAFAERPGDFRVIGPGGGGAMFHPTISPHDSNTALVACDMTGAYITHDGGQSWRMFSLRGDVHFFVFDPSDAKTMYAQATGLWRSVDNGETWGLVYPKPATVKYVAMGSDHADEIIVAEPNPLGTVAALAVDPASSRVLYAAAGTQQSAALFLSNDYGETWREEAKLPDLPRYVWVDPNSPVKSRRLFIGGAGGIVVQDASGAHRLPFSDTGKFVDASLGFASGAQPVVYAVLGHDAFVSQDGGSTWAKSSLPGNGAEVQAVATSLHHPETAYLSYSQLSLDGKKWMGVAKTTDAGKHWQLVWKESDVSATNVHDNWISDSLGVDWSENPLVMGVDENDANRCYATDLGRTMRTVDGGSNWTGVYSRRVPGAEWTSTGLDVTTSYGIHFDPFDGKREFITYTDIGLFRSEDGGRSWASSTAGVPGEWRNTTYWIEFDPKVRGRMWSVNSGTHDLPRPKMWRTRSSSKFKGGVCVSDDGGRTWTKSNAGMEETGATHILLDPTSPENARVLYVAGFGRGVYKSSDGGRTWKLKNQGITQDQPFAWRLARDSAGTLYLLLARRSEDGGIGNAGDGAIYRSTDGAETWRPVAMPAGVNAPNGLTIDPDSPKRLYLAAWSRAAGTHGEGGGIYLSNNGGESWEQVLDRDRHIYDVTIDPGDSNTLYATGFESSVWRSVDRGLHWVRVPGFNFKWGHRVVVDPTNRSKIYVTTFGGGVWHGSVDGKSRPVDIATPELEPGQ